MLPSVKKTSLQTLINHFFDTEKLTEEGGNSYFCLQCNSLQNATKKISFTREENFLPPDYLILTLNRFIYIIDNGSVNGTTKIMEQIDYPTIIEIKTYIEEEVNFKFFLFHLIKVFVFKTSC